MPSQMKDLHHTFKYVGLYQTTIPTLMITDIELLKDITVKHFDHFANHRQTTTSDDPIWTQNLFSLKGNGWKRMRTTVSPIFTSSKMKITFNLLSECADNYTAFLKKTNDTTTIELRDLFSRYTNDVIASVAFGVTCDSINQKDNEFYQMGRDITTISFTRMIGVFGNMLAPGLCKLLGITVFPVYLSNFFKKLIKDSIKIREDQGIVRPDLIHLMLEARKGKTKPVDENSEVEAGFAAVKDTKTVDEDVNQSHEITDTDIIAQAIVFFFGGFETVATALTFMSHELTANPDIQQRLQEEIDDVMKTCNGKLTYEALMKMKYMDMVVSESLRKWPVGVVTDRVCTKTFTIEPKKPNETPVTLQPGDTIWIPVNGIHRDPKYYPNPEKFDPERFSDENKDKIVPYSYMPFGVGPRHCVASRFALMELKTVIFHMLHNFDFVVTEKTEIPLKIDKGSFNLIAENGVWVGLKPRNR